MTGRELFKSVAPVINTYVFFLGLLPKSILKLKWAFMSSFPGILGDGFRYCLVKALAKSCGENVRIGVNVEICGWSKLEIGNNVSIHRESYIDAQGGLKIGNNVSIAHQCSILTENHSWEDENLPIKYNPMFALPVEIESDVWLGCAVRIMPGVKIFRRSIVAAGAVVSSNVESRTIVGGVPAKVIKTL